MDAELLKNIPIETPTIITIGATIFNLYLVYKSYKIAQTGEEAKKPVIDIKLDNLPPYENEKEKTILRLKNVGTKEINRDFITILSCSWIPSLSMKFNLPSPGYFLAPNEEIIWKFRLDENFPPASTVFVRVDDRSFKWELTEQL